MYRPAPKSRITGFVLSLSLISIQAFADPQAAFTANSTLGCAPLAVQFTNQSTGAVSYYWDLGNGNTSTLPNPVNVYTTPGTYSVMLIATDASGHSDTSFHPNGITVVDVPMADFSASTTSSCLEGNVIPFLNNASPGTTCLWDFGDGTISTLSQPTHIYMQAGSFSVNLMVTNAQGCSQTKTIPNFITIHPEPEASILVNKTDGCDSSDIFQFSSASPLATSWLWNFGDSTTSSLAAPAHQFPTSGTFHTSLVVTTAFGCRDTSDTLATVRILPTYWADIWTGDDSACAPFACSFFQNYTGVSSRWDFGDGSTSLAVAPTHTYTSPGTYSVSLIITLSIGCTDTVVKPGLVTVGDKPLVDFSVSGTRGCSPFAAAFTNLTTNAASVQWNFGDGSISTQNNPVHTYTNAGDYAVTLTGISAFGCSQSLSRPGYLHVSTPAAMFSTPTRSGCPPLDVTFTNSSAGGSMTYAWDFGDGGTSTLANPLHTYSTTGVFPVTLIIRDSSGCTDTLTKQAYIQVSDPSAGYIAPPTTVGCAPYTTRFTDGTAGAISWLWNFGDGTTSTLQNPTHTYTDPGFYTVSLTTQSSNGSCAGNIPQFSTFNIQGGFAAFTDSFDQCPPYDVSFFDSSSGAISWFWQFGDGTTSTLQNPTHTYAVPGYHSVSLAVTTAAGCTFSTMKSNGIYFAPFAANFYGIPMSSSFPMTVNFYANSIGANAWLWDFGDTTFSTLENPIHTYPDSGDYNVTLTISNGLCTLFYDPPPLVFSPPDSSQMQPPPAGSPPVPQYGCAPFIVSFAYNVPGTIDWTWYFGDGDSAAAQYPIHTYTTPGNYSVDLLVTDSFGVETLFQFDTIVHVNGPQAAFSFAQTPNCQHTQINLVNSSSYATSYTWDFGDGTFDTTHSPVHVYTSGLPNYIISLRATDSYGCQSILSTSMFAHAAQPVLVSETDVCGTDSVHFSSGFTNYTAYDWDFGDGTTDTLEAPAHVYSLPGVYWPSLTVTDPNGCAQTHISPIPVTVNAPQADFSTPQVHGCDSLPAGFINRSASSDSYVWNFGDGTTSTHYQPVHNYNQAGVYSVTLVAYSNGCVDTLTRPNYVRIDTAHAAFSYSFSEVCLPFTATFTDLSAHAVSWLWDFADNRTSLLQSPVHVYDSINPYQGVTLTIVDTNGCQDKYEAPMFSGPRIAVSADRTSGCMPLTVTFTGTRSWTSTFFWDFGDGTTSTDPNPVHTYTSPGFYRVKLVASSQPEFGLCTDSVYLEDTIRVVEPVSSFISPDPSSCAPSLVNFVNSSADADSYVWQFGDGSTSNSVSPTHLYKNPGTYSVSLVAISGEGCSDTLLRSQYIRVLGPLTLFQLSDTVGCLPLTVQCTDSSLDAVTWMWNFGDGYSSSDPYPVHTYTDSGVYSVTLITTDTVGCTSFLEYPFRVHANPNPVAGFTVSDSAGCDRLTANFSNMSSGFSSIWYNFGDGGYSIVANPVHTYTDPGIYEASLIAFNRYGCTDTLINPSDITVHLAPVAAFSPSATQGCSPLAVLFTNQSTDTLEATYNWSFGNGQTATTDDPLAIFANPGLYTVSLSVTNANGCTDSISSTSLIHVLDTLPPSVSEIMSASVLNDTSVEITWENNAAIDLGAYVLYRLNTQTGSYEIIYTDTNPSNTNFALTSTYTDHGLNTLRQVYSYKLQTLDICSNTLPLEILRAHSTVDVEAAVTGLNIVVSWNAYGGCPVSSYEIFRAAGSGSFQRIGTVPGDSLVYTDSAFLCPDQFIYRIQGLDLCGNPYTSWSDTAAARPFNVFADQKVEMVRSTVVGNEFVLTEWLPPIVRPLSVVAYDLYRSTDNIHFTFLTTLSPQQTDYSDYNVQVQEQRYFYKVKVRNNCDVDLELGDNTTTILLRGEKTEDRVVHLQWTPYDRWADGVEYYTVERLDENGNWQLIRQVNGVTTVVEFREE